MAGQWRTENPNMPQPRVIALYGKLADPLGPAVRIESDPHETIADMRARLAALDPRLDALMADCRIRACVAGKIASEDRVPSEGEVVEFLPVVSGG